MNFLNKNNNLYSNFYINYDINNILYNGRSAISDVN